ncbi:MAG: phospho-sugar mutase [Micrococcales bacterium]|nr:phospho-sugar mutase [Micrococcales bacterium]
MPSELAAQVAAWIADDPDPATAAELAGLLAAWRDGDDEARAELADRFAGPLEFGTAGLRGALGGGPGRMNRAVVIRTAAGLGTYLHAGLDAPARVVVGYDARHGSHTFALDTAAVLTAAGAQVLVLPGALPTPVLAFAVRHTDADAGVMVTASHNRASDNGYKVYLGGPMTTDAGRGVQIVPPADERIAAATAAVRSVASVPRAAAGWTVLGPAIVEAYQAALRDELRGEGRASASVPHREARPSHLRIVLTAMHGVGGGLGTAVLRDAGFTDLHLVDAQARPDPDFPTVVFPNPEEPGALDLAYALASTVHADLVLALDPDADRCAVAVPDGPGWRRLHGDETGALLGADTADRCGPDGVLACSVVSSRLLEQIATRAGLGFAQTLTGFKWIARVPHLVFGYEEALGYCVAPQIVRDKDGIAAAVLVATLAARLKATGRTLLDRLDDLARAHGLYLTDQLTVPLADPAQITALVEQVRTAGPAALAGSPVVATTDLAQGTATLPPTDGVVLRCADDTRVVVRPSGTEPKLKCYLEVVHPVPTGTNMPALRATARAHLAHVAADLRTALGLDTRDAT